MSQSTAFTILLDEQPRIAWQTGEDVEFVAIESAVDSPEVMAPEIAGRLSERGYNGQGVMLAIPSRMCFAVAPPSEFDANTSNHQALAYAVEPWLPFAAEDVTVMPIGAWPSCLWLVAVTAPLAAVIDALE